MKSGDYFSTSATFIEGSGHKAGF